MVVSGATRVKGKLGPKVSGGPSTRAERCQAGAPGNGSPKSTSHRSFTNAVVNRMLSVSEIGRPRFRIGTELIEFVCNSLAELRTAQRLGCGANGLDQGCTGGSAQGNELFVGVAVNPYRRRSHHMNRASSVCKCYGSLQIARFPATMGCMAYWFERLKRRRQRLRIIKSHID